MAVPYAPGEAAPAAVAPACGGFAAYMPELARGIAGELVAVCIDGPPGKAKGSRAKPRAPSDGGVDADGCLRVAATSMDGKRLLADKQAFGVAVRRIECGAAGGVVLVHAGGRLALTSRPALAEDLAPGCEPAAPRP